jgi:50S ribosomal protein L16 3-hydroxylase
LFSSNLVPDLNTFQSQFWRRKAAALGQVPIDCLDELDADLLLSLAESDQVESRVITLNSDRYELTLGPFDNAGLGSGQMLMVQNLESFLPQVSVWLSDCFDFLPRWRIEDVMATLANAGGNCGAHFDQYDVFLVQLRGEKHWSLDVGSHKDSDLLDDSEIRLLSEFAPHEQIHQGPGDVLYIPPGVGHHGIASDDSLTLSVGIRNPLMAEMAAYLADQLIQSNSEQTSLNDRLTGRFIDTEEVAGLGEQLAAALTSPAMISEWYGAYMTEPRDHDILEYSDVPEDLNAWLESRPALELQLAARIAIQDHTLFVNGEANTIQTCPDWLLELQQKRTVLTSMIQPSEINLVESLIQCGGVVA